jgi:hypothetical protein
VCDQAQAVPTSALPVLALPVSVQVAGLSFSDEPWVNQLPSSSYPSSTESPGQPGSASAGGHPPSKSIAP